MVRKKIIFILLLLPNLVIADPRLRPLDWAQPMINTDVSNMYQVDAGVYRSAQPDDEGFVDISKFGIREILSLREYHSDNEKAKDLGFSLYRIKIDTSDMSQNDVIDALSIILKRKGPILVHCWHGSDRTGAVIASYRIVVQGWSKKKAIDEMVNGGFGYHSQIFPNIADLIKSLDVDQARTKLGLHIGKSG